MAAIPAQAVQGMIWEGNSSPANCTQGITADRTSAFAKNSSIKGWYWTPKYRLIHSIHINKRYRPNGRAVLPCGTDSKLTVKQGPACCNVALFPLQQLMLLFIFHLQLLAVSEQRQFLVCTKRARSAAFPLGWTLIFSRVSKVAGGGLGRSELSRGHAWGSYLALLGGTALSPWS